MREIIQTALLPTLLQHRRKFVQLRAILRRQLREESPDAPAVSEDENSLSLILTFDGEKQFLDASIYLFEEQPPAYLKDANVQMIKLAAACTGFQQPNDVMSSFRTLKKVRQTGVDLAEEDYMADVRELVLKPLESGSRKTFGEFIGKLPAYLSRAYCKDTVKKGWMETGIYPYAPLQMLSRWLKVQAALHSC